MFISKILFTFYHKKSILYLLEKFNLFCRKKAIWEVLLGILPFLKRVPEKVSEQERNGFEWIILADVIPYARRTEAFLLPE